MQPLLIEQCRRQSEVVQSALAPAIAFLNSRNQTLECKPLHLAIESDEGLARVESLLQRTTAAGLAMRRKTAPETDELRDIRMKTQLRERRKDDAAKDTALNAAVRNCIKLHGA